MLQHDHTKAITSRSSERLKHFLTDLKGRGLYRRRQVLSNKDYVFFNSNDYLSLKHDKRIQDAYEAGIKRYAMGSGGSMLVCGYHSVHEMLEKEFATALGVEQCLLFSSGYAANLSVAALLARMGFHIMIDKCLHASFYDGLQGSRARFSRYRHNDLSDLAIKLQALLTQPVILTESLFSMSGQYAPLHEINQLAQPTDACLIIDEAHAFGVVGERGLGAVYQAGLPNHRVPLRIIPLGKAFGGSGAIVAGEALWVDALLQCARPAIYSTALSPAFAYGLLQTLEIVQAADARRRSLQGIIDYFRTAIKTSPLNWRDSISPIQQVQLGCPFKAEMVAKHLQDKGIVCMSLRQPTVIRQESGLRISLNCAHEPGQIDTLLECLHEI